MSNRKQTVPAHSLAEKASEKTAAIKEGLIEGKNKLLAVVEEKYESAKKAIHDMTAP